MQGGHMARSRTGMNEDGCSPRSEGSQQQQQQDNCPDALQPPSTRAPAAAERQHPLPHLDSSSTTMPPPSTVSTVRASRLGVSASKSYQPGTGGGMWLSATVS